MQLKFKTLIDKIDDFVSNKIDSSDFIEWLHSKLEIRKYIGLDEKMVILELATERFNSEMSFDNEEEFRKECFKKYEMSLIFDLLLGYTNTIIPSIYRNSETYDKLVNSPFYNIVLECCHNDYNRMVDLYKNKTGIDNITMLFTLAEIFGINQKPEDFEKIKDIINNEINLEKLNALLKINEMNNPMMTKIVDKTFKDVAIEKLAKV